jgi:hypothetical protein
MAVAVGDDHLIPGEATLEKANQGKLQTSKSKLQITSNPQKRFME